jgi:CRP/FNR family cyclic AMP-dependent transcriptional regulator
MSDNLGEKPDAIDWQEVHKALPAVGILQGMNDPGTLAGYGQYLNCQPGEEIIHEGAKQNDLYIVIEGQLEISARVSGKKIVLAKAGPGECFGEASLLCSCLSGTTVKALKKALLWKMDARAFQKYLAEHRGGGGVLMLGMAKCLIRRLRAANAKIAHHYLTPNFAMAHYGKEAIRAPDMPAQTSLFAKIKNSLTGPEKTKISTKIKM